VNTGAREGLIYINKLEVKDTTNTQNSASYIDLHLEIDIGRRLKTKFDDIHDNFTFLYSQMW
jgi:hypothetical protein